MDNKNSYALKITTGAMILAIFAILLLINRQTGAFFEEFFIYLLPIPMVAYASRYGLKSSLPVFVGMLAFSFFFGTVTTFFYAGTAALLGMIFGTRIYHKRDLTQTMLLVMVLSTVFNVLSTIALASVFGYDLVREVNEMQDMMGQVVSQTGADPQAYAPLLEGGYIKQLIVISAVIFGMVQGYIIYVLSLLILKRLRFQVPKARPITLLYPPKWTGFAAIILFFIGFRSFTQSSENEIVQRLLQCGWTIGYLYLIVFGVIALYLVIRKYLLRNTALAVILAILVTYLLISVRMKKACISPPVSMTACCGPGRPNPKNSTQAALTGPAPPTPSRTNWRKSICGLRIWRSMISLPKVKARQNLRKEMNPDRQTDPVRRICTIMMLIPCRKDRGIKEFVILYPAVFPACPASDSCAC